MKNQAIITAILLLGFSQIGNASGLNSPASYSMDCEDIDATICSGETFEFEGQVFDENGVYTLTSDNCDGMFDLNLSVIEQPQPDSTIVDICSGESYFWNSNHYTTSGTYLYSPEEGNCEADQVLILTVIPRPDDRITYACICTGDEYHWVLNGSTYHMTGTYVITGDDCNGSDYLVLMVDEHCGMIGGTVFRDQDNDGIYQNTTEARYEDLSIELYRETNGQFSYCKTVRSDFNGEYRFMSIEEGNYYLKVEYPDGYENPISNYTEDGLTHNRIDNTYGPHTSPLIPLADKEQVITWHVGIQEVITSNEYIDDSKVDILLSPNPTKETLTINIQSDIQSSNRISIHNEYGQLVQSLETVESVISIDCSEYPTGVYFILMSNGDERVVRKVVVL